MSYDERLAQRVRAELSKIEGLTEKKMFGGVGFMLRGNMACGVHGDDVIVRVGPTNYERALSQPYTAVFDMTGRPMTGWVLVKPEGCKKDSDLRAWVKQGVDYALTLPGKP
jgi:TfoX/Sxy family transcriptional regulator of competence genes